MTPKSPSSTESETDTERAAVRRALQGAERVALAGHLPLDGDGLGSALALTRALRTSGRRTVALLGDDPPPNLRFLPGVDDAVRLPDALPFVPDVFVALDGGDRDRFGALFAALPETVTVINMDHHVSNTRFGDVNWVDPGYAATGLMAYDLIRDLRLPIDRDAAVCLYTTLVTDTGRFSYSNTSPHTHLAAADLLTRGVRPEEVLQHVYRCKTRGQLALFADVIGRLQSTEDGRVAWTDVPLALRAQHGIGSGETGDLVEIPTSLAGVDVALLFREYEGETRVSIRTTEALDATTVAVAYGGGGHPRAAGLPFDGPLETAKEQVVASVIAALAEADRERA